MRLSNLLLTHGVVRHGYFILASGMASQQYIDVKSAASHPDVLRQIGEELSGHMGDAVRIAGMELGAVPLAAAASLYSGIPFLMIRKEVKPHGTSSLIEGKFEPGMEVVIVEDVATSGGSIARSVEMLREADLVVKRAVAVVDRERGATDLLAAIGVTFISLVKSSDLLSNG